MWTFRARRESTRSAWPADRPPRALPRVRSSAGPVGTVRAALLILLAARSAGAAQPLPIEDANVAIPTTASVLTYTIDLRSLPERPVIEIEVIADSQHPDMRLQIETSDWTNPNYIITAPSDCPEGSDPAPSAAGTGRAKLQVPIYRCQPFVSQWASGTSTATVRIRTTDFGAQGGPATATVSIRGVTRPPTGTLSIQFESASTPRTIEFEAIKDTVLYDSLPYTSNGAGSFLWAGRGDPFERRALVAFDFGSVLATTSIVNHATLTLHATGTRLGLGGAARLWSLGPFGGRNWAEGDAIGPGDQYYGGPSAAISADWITSGPIFAPWITPGGDLASEIAEEDIDQPGPWVVSNPSLTSAVQQATNNGFSGGGFIVTMPEATDAIQFASREHPDPTLRPRLSINYTPTVVGSAAGDVRTDALGYVDEGQSFRWIYDLDRDGTLVTPNGGVCEFTNPNQEFLLERLPYRYTFQGSPSYIGVECCTWRLEAPTTGTIGTGQVLAYHNLNVGDPANRPIDSDGDGIVDICDNCVDAPNGPLLGSCRSGPSVGSICRSNRDCGIGGACDNSQDDTDEDFVGNACVPEPGIPLAVLIGSGCLASRPRSRRARPESIEASGPPIPGRADSSTPPSAL